METRALFSQESVADFWSFGILGYAYLHRQGLRLMLLCRNQAPPEGSVPSPRQRLQNTLHSRNTQDTQTEVSLRSGMTTWHTLRRPEFWISVCVLGSIIEVLILEDFSPVTHGGITSDRSHCILTARCNSNANSNMANRSLWEPNYSLRLAPTGSYRHCCLAIIVGGLSNAADNSSYCTRAARFLFISSATWAVGSK